MVRRSTSRATVTSARTRVMSRGTRRGWRNFSSTFGKAVCRSFTFAATVWAGIPCAMASSRLSIRGPPTVLAEIECVRRLG